MIRVHDVSIRFGDRLVVENVGFETPDGEAFGLVGESGSGKTTLLRSIAGLSTGRVTGELSWNGFPLTTRRSPEQRRRMQLVFQDPYGSLHPGRTVDQTLAAPLAINRIGGAEARIKNALDDVGLGPQHRFRYPNQLSGGQRQRVAIARALILEPTVLLLDEPTSALDVSVQAEILNLLQRLRQERNLTIVMVSHDLAVVAHLCSRIAIMQAGRIIETTTPAALAKRDSISPYAADLVRANAGYSRPGESTTKCLP